MSKILETINKEKIIKKHRRELINENNFRKITEMEKLFIEANEDKCTLCKKKLSMPYIFDKAYITYKNKWNYFCSFECFKEFNEKITKKNENNQIKDFSRTHLFAGNEFNQELEQLSNQELKNQINFIDFNFHSQEKPEFIEKKIKEIYHNSQNQKLIEEENFPIICFKNIEKIESNKNLEEALLPIFDQQQNSELFHGEVNLSNFIILTTTSTPQIGKLSDPLISRLDVVNVETVQNKQFFLDKYYYWFLIPSILINLILITLILLPKISQKKNIVKS